jgi:hypothetical protein
MIFGNNGRSGTLMSKITDESSWLWKRNKVTGVDVSRRTHRNGEFPMPYTRPIRRFYLTPPAVPTFAISVVLAVVALLAVYGHFPQLHSIGGFTILLIAYVILLAGTLLRGV